MDSDKNSIKWVILSMLAILAVFSMSVGEVYSETLQIVTSLARQPNYELTVSKISDISLAVSCSVFFGILFWAVLQAVLISPRRS